MGELIQCKQCQIFVHIECYYVDTLEGAEYVDREKQFTCIACQYVETYGFDVPGNVDMRNDLFTNGFLFTLLSLFVLP
jgi:hypothetical protein